MFDTFPDVPCQVYSKNSLQCHKLELLCCRSASWDKKFVIRLINQLYKRSAYPVKGSLQKTSPNYQLWDLCSLKEGQRCLNGPLQKDLGKHCNSLQTTFGTMDVSYPVEITSPFQLGALKYYSAHDYFFNSTAILVKSVAEKHLTAECLSICCQLCMADES